MENCGICSLSIVPVRAEPSDKSEITTQLIFGDLYQIIEKNDNGKWIKIKTEYDKYEGWIDFKQSKSISQEKYEQLLKADKYKTTGIISRVKLADGEILVPAGSTFYSGYNEKAFFETINIKNEVKNFEEKTPAEIISIAKSYLNVPYLWGGKTHFGIDCSGFTQQVFGICGYKLPRDAWQQEQVGQEIRINDIKPTDVAFFKNEKGKIVHVGIILENSEIIHASGKVRVDKLDNKGIYKRETNEYSHHLASIKRVIN
ncbi:MAG TPA: C40 family peptidase [Cytophagales bacterium]|nr:C40 family peptidase [Cytophagales bacterium]